MTLLREGVGVRGTTSDEQGRFAFSKLSSGSYTLSVTAEGFVSYEELREVGDSVTPERVLITLYAGMINEKVTVDSSDTINMDPARAAGTHVLSRGEIAWRHWSRRGLRFSSEGTPVFNYLESYIQAPLCRAY